MPAAAGSVGDRDVAEAVEERVARAARPAVPALGRRDRAPGAVAFGQVDRRRHRLVVHPHAPPVRSAMDLEHGHLGQGPDLEPVGDLVVRVSHRLEYVRPAVYRKPGKRGASWNR